jgi:hypothetical protein
MAGGIVIEEEKRILGSIEAHGWYAVHRYDPELVEPNYTYSVGFSQTLDAPEFIVFGLHRDVMYDMLAGFTTRSKRAGNSKTIRSGKACTRISTASPARSRMRMRSKNMPCWPTGSGPAMAMAGIRRWSRSSGRACWTGFIHGTRAAAIR